MLEVTFLDKRKIGGVEPLSDLVDAKIRSYRKFIHIFTFAVRATKMDFYVTFTEIQEPWKEKKINVYISKEENAHQACITTIYLSNILKLTVFLNPKQIKSLYPLFFHQTHHTSNISAATPFLVLSASESQVWLLCKYPKQIINCV